ncbi:MAG: DinB family protein [Propionibacteriaceae bacterium]|nr:DinB family protein [Propionibacteriaceae bacterium]
MTDSAWPKWSQTRSKRPIPPERAAAARLRNQQEDLAYRLAQVRADMKVTQTEVTRDANAISGPLKPSVEITRTEASWPRRLAAMDTMKQILTGYLTNLRQAVAWKLDGVSERAARTPLTPTGTNLLGLVKHLGIMEFGYFGTIFGRETDEPMARMDAEVWATNADLWATPDEDLATVRGFYARAIAQADQTIAALDLDQPVTVPWWPPQRQNVTLARILVHVIAETARHAGHMDILREQLDGQVGTHPELGGLPPHDAAWWADYTGRLREMAANAPE